MTRIVFLTHSQPHSVGNGGNHRSYQLLHDLQRVVPHDDIRVIVRPHPNAKTITQNTPSRSHATQTSTRTWNRLKQALGRRWKQIVAARENPYALAVNNSFSINRYVTPNFVANYETVVREARPDIAIIDHAGFAPILAVNKKYGIRTIACPHNLESLDEPYPHYSRSALRWRLKAATHNLANELAILTSCDACLCISKVETAFIRGMGFPADYYAYQPVGDIRDFLARIAQKRQTTPQEQGLFLMPGSAFHHSTRDGMLWLLRQIETHGGLPDGMRIVIFGAQSHTLPSVPSVTAHGWIEQENLEYFLTVASSILIPQFRGFGTPTKLIEFASINMPIIASEHVMCAVDPLPRVYGVGQSWETWLDAMCKLMSVSSVQSSTRSTAHTEAVRSEVDHTSTVQESRLESLIRRW
jgi:hypothetical protein